MKVEENRTFQSKQRGPPLPRRIGKRYALMKKVARGAVPTDACWNGTLATDGCWMGGPCNLFSYRLTQVEDGPGKTY